MRFISILALLAGVGVIYAYPWAVKNFTGREIGIYRVFDRSGPFRPTEVPLTSADGPMRVMVELTAVAPPASQPEETPVPTIISVAASTQGKMVFNQTLKLRNITTRERNRKVPDPMFRDVAGLIPDVQPGIYRFEIGRQSSDNVQLRSVDLVLRGGVMEVDQRAHPIGFFLLAGGLAGFAVSVAREHGRTPAPRWGRGAEKS